MLGNMAPGSIKKLHGAKHALEQPGKNCRTIKMAWN
jgi:hypothetical protein